MSSVFGNLGHEAIIVTKDDNAYGLGSNSSGCLGIDTLASSLTPVKIEALCQKQVKGFAYGAGPHVIAFTEDGFLYAWGHNGFMQLGLGNSCQTMIPTLVTGSLQGKKVVQVACGNHHTMALTDDGEIYAFGQNSSGQVGCGSTANQPTPRRVSAIGNNKIVQISCGQTSSFAVSENGELLAWGLNSSGQLGIGNTVNQYNPSKVLFSSNSVFIIKIACGAAHTLALADDGSLYTFGANSYGQLGAGHKSNCSTPQRVAIEFRVVDIGAVHYSHTSAFSTHTKIYMFGQCRGQAIVSPVETNFTSMQDVFACYSTPSVTYIPIEARLYEEQSIVDALKLAFDDPQTSDIKFLVEEKQIHAHKAILRIRSDHFRCMFQGNTWKEGNESEIKIDLGVRYTVFRAFLQFLYTDKIDLPAEDAVDLLKLANYYCEMRLKTQCELLIKQSITIENTAKLYSSAIQYNAKDLEEFVFQYMVHHLTEVVKSESFMELDGDLVKNLMILLGAEGAFKY